MSDANLRYQVSKAMIAALPPIPDGTCTRDIATDTADVMRALSARAEHRVGVRTRCADWDKRSMATERGGEEARTRRTPQQQPPNGREDGWKTSPDVSQGCRAELILRFRPQTRNTHSRRRPDQLLQTSNDDKSGREARLHIGVRQK